VQCLGRVLGCGAMGIGCEEKVQNRDEEIDHIRRRDGMVAECVARESRRKSLRADRHMRTIVREA
jgi:hypothetical protein